MRTRIATVLLASLFLAACFGKDDPPAPPPPPPPDCAVGMDCNGTDGAENGSGAAQ